MELRLFEATTAVDLAAFDDAGFAEEMDRARDRGMGEAAYIVDHTVNLVTGVVGMLATAAAVTVIQPLLLPCLLLAAVPQAVTAVRMARREYLAMLARITRQRRMWMLAHLMANRHTAAEIRAYQMRGFLLAEYRGVMAVETRAQMRLVRSQTGTPGGRGVASRGWPPSGCTRCSAACCWAAMVALAAAATALLALQSARTSLGVAIGRHQLALRGRPLLPGLPGLPGPRPRPGADRRRAGGRRASTRSSWTRSACSYPDTGQRRRWTGSA